MIHLIVIRATAVDLGHILVPDIIVLLLGLGLLLKLVAEALLVGVDAGDNLHDTEVGRRLQLLKHAQLDRHAIPAAG